MPFSPGMIRPRGEFKSQSYPLSIYTRTAREICSKSELIFGQQKQQPQKRFPRKTLTGFSTDFVNNKNRLAGGWHHSVTPTTSSSVFPVPSSITKSEPRRGPRDFLFDEFGNGERDAEFFFACREALAGCRGAALTRRHLSECACAVRQMHILSRFLRVCVTRTLAQCRQFLRRAALHGSAQFWQPDSKSFCRFRAAAVPRDRQTGSRGISRSARSAHLYNLYFVSIACGLRR